MGPAILDQLLNAGFKVTALTRKSSNHSFPPSVTPVPVDYDSLESLTNALKGQDALVSTLAMAPDSAQLLLVEAAVKAHVKRFLPSEFGSDTLNEKARALPVFKPKIAVQDELMKQAASGSLTYTLVATGPFFDWGLKVGFLMGLKEKTISLYDGGDRLYSTTNLSTIGKAVVGVLKHPEQTKNRAVYVQDTALTQKQLLAFGKKAVGADGWKETTPTIDQALQDAYDELKKEKPNHASFVYNFIRASIWGEGYGCHFKKLDNELLGIKGLSEAEVQDVVNGVAGVGA